MKKIILILTILLGIIIGLGLMHFISLSASANQDLDKDFEPKQLYEANQMVIKEAKEKPIIDKEKAIEIAKKSGPTNAKHIHAQYVLLTDKGIMTESFKKSFEKNPKLSLNEYIKEIPVWIISFRGLDVKRLGGKVTRTELNIVIDATTGEELYGFTLR